ncbi:uncharacterized protein LOC133505312 [Syngnathoides biaculeatus]|uniref:uncharacterized protein LOC133505312 n=1 Tax=Syngnathoides biaculeatus TaxID=300417 RepID=UPI002ADE32DB|nr:uncharacterized protein LOC133505312 [Syngnathoides biaculeatus]
MLQEASSAQAVDINPTDLVHSKSCETEKVAGKKQWKQKQSKRLSQAKKEKLDRAQDQRSLNLGAAFQRWRDFRQERGFNTDAELATFLLDFVCTKDTHTGNQDNLKNPKVNKLKEECQHLDNNDPKLTLVKWLVPVLKKESWVKSSGRGPGEHGEKGTKDDSVDAPLEDEVLDSRGRFKEEDAEPEAEWQPYEDQPVSYSGYNVPDLSDNADLSEMATVNKMTIKLEPDEEQHVDVKKEMKEELKIENPLLPVFDAGWKTCETDPKHGQDGGRPAVQVKMESERSDLKRAREENGGHNEDEQTQKKRSIPLDRDGHHGGGLRCQDAGQDRDFPRGCKEDELNQTLTSLLTEVAHLTFLTDKLSAHVREMCRKQVSFSLHSKK